MTGAQEAALPPAPRHDCPKLMAYGPCGGVTPDGGCELPPRRCVFVDEPVVRWVPAPSSGSVIGAATGPVFGPVADVLGEALDLAPDRPAVIVDLPARPLDVESLQRCAGALAGAADAVLLGDHGGQRVQLPPAQRAGLVQAEGVRAWAGLNCRDRNRVALEGELAGLAVAGVAGVHCVTGDHPWSGHRPDAAAVFDLDSTRLVPLARSRGLVTSVAENPTAPPTPARPQRLLEKVKAGAQVCFVNHTTGPAAVDRFVAAALTACAAQDRTVSFVSCVAVVLDEASADVLRSFTGLALPSGYLDSILGARDVQAAGIDGAVALARSLLAVPGVRGVNLSTGARPGDEIRVAAALATIASRLRE